MEIIPKRIEYYSTASGRTPFRDWYSELRDLKARIAIRRRLTRLQHGLLEDSKSVGNGVFELRIHFGPGYRIYFGQQGMTSVLLLCGGDKDSQTRDIVDAQSFWTDHLRRGES